MEEKIAESLAHFSSRGSKVSIKIDGEMQEIATIVRCKDCKHFGRYYGDSKNGVCEKLNIIGRSEDWFCADGERKKG